MSRVNSLGRSFCLLALVGVGGCFDDPAPAVTDSGAVDSGAVDSGAADSGAVDSGAVDSGVRPDSGTPADTGVVPDTGTAVDVPAAAPTVALTAPASGANISIGAPTQLTLAITNFTLTNFVGVTSNQPGRGHVHVYLDANDNNDYLVADYIERPRVVIPNGTTVGAHTLRIALRNNDHSPLSPPVQVTVPFMAVMNTAPSVVVTSPADNSNVMAGADLTLMLSFMNFASRDFMGQMGVTPPNGHFHVYLDGATGGDYLIATHVPAPVVRIPASTTAGAHRLTVSLRNDDHSEIVGASAELRINVTR